MARKKHKKVARKRFSWGCFLFLCLLCVGIGFGGWWLSQEAARQEQARRVLEDTATEAQRLAEAAGAWIAAEWPTQAPGERTYSTGNIELWFGPSRPADPNGIDDGLLNHIRSARERIHAAFYDLQLEQAAEALIERHRAGVEVLIVSDSHYDHREALRACQEAGIPVRLDERSAFMHNKFCVVDGQSVWLGSANVTDNGKYRNDNNALRIDSPHMAANFRAEFEELYGGAFGPRSPANTPYPMIELGDISIETYFAPEDGVEAAVLRHVGTANRSIHFLAFSYTSVPISRAMAARLARGVPVRGVFEARNAHSRYSRDEFLAKAGAEIRLDGNPNSMHHKVILLDDDRVLTGSYNFSKAAETSNDENLLVMHDAELRAAFQQEFERVWAVAE